MQKRPHDFMSEGELARCDFVTSKLPLGKRGIEIAPYFNPIVDRTRHDVLYVDCIDNDEIQRKAAENPGATGRIVPSVDAVWVPGVPLAKCIGHEPLFYAVASHVFEHVPNPLGWIQEILDCLEPGGVIALLVPNREQSMDFYRRPTSFAEVIGWSIEKPARPTPTQVMDFLSQSFEDDGSSDFSVMPPFSRAKRHYTDNDAIGFAEFVAKEDHYLDVHCSVWTPESFLEVFTRVSAARKLAVEIEGPFVGFPGSPSYEFLVCLHKRDPGGVTATSASVEETAEDHPVLLKKPAVLHIGAPKAGSSALQYDLTWNPLRASIQDQSLSYEYVSLLPGQLFRGRQMQQHAGNFSADYSMSADLSVLTRQAPDLLRQARTALAAVHRDGRVPILSYETWLHATPEQVATFTESLGGSLKIVVYVRPPVQWLASLYYQRNLKWARAEAQFLETNLGRTRWIDAIRTWESAPSVDRVDIRLHTHDICSDFCNLLGCQSSGISVQHNKPLPSAAIDLMSRGTVPEEFSLSEAKYALSRWRPKASSASSQLAPAAFPFDARVISEIITATRDASQQLLDVVSPEIRQAMDADPRWWSDDPSVHVPAAGNAAACSLAGSPMDSSDAFTMVLWESLLEADSAWRRDRRPQQSSQSQKSS